MCYRPFSIDFPLIKLSFVNLSYAAAIDLNRMTLTSVRNPSEILGQRNGMSRKDAIQINKMYECANFVNRV